MRIVFGEFYRDQRIFEFSKKLGIEAGKARRGRSDGLSGRSGRNSIERSACSNRLD